MYVLEVFITRGTSEGKAWESRTAVCQDHFKGKDGEGDYITLCKLSRDCPIPDADVDVQPLFDRRGKVADFRECGG